MDYLLEDEREYIKKLIDNKQESLILDFKTKWYDYKNKETAKDKVELIKDCIAFLNVTINYDRYIVLGVSEDKSSNSFEICGVDGQLVDEAEFQQVIEQYIEPFPQISLILDFKYAGKNLHIIKIKRENKDQPYLFKKSIKKKQKDKISEIHKGVGYIRHGSSTNELSREEISNLILKKQKSVFSFFDLNTSITPKNINKVLVFLDTMDKIINKDGLDAIANMNRMFKIKMNTVFENLVVAELLFMSKIDNEDLILKNILKIKSIIDCTKDNVDEQIKNSISNFDNGENSIIEALFCITYSFYKIINDEIFYIDSNQNICMKNSVSHIMLNDNYIDIKNKINIFNILFDYLINIEYRFYNINLLNISKIKFHDDIVNIIEETNIKFKIDERIIPLLVEPLYGKNNFHVSLRELLQNSIDACKVKYNQHNIGKYTIKINVNIINDGTNTICIQDDGIGMDWNDISNYYLTIGKSSKSISQYGLVGKFGIGVLAMFLIGDTAEIVTSKYHNLYEYSFMMQKNNETTTMLLKRKVDYDKSYTYIRIFLNDNIKIYKFTDFKVKFQIDKLLVNNKSIDIRINFNNELEYDVPNINGYINEFKVIYDNDDVRGILCYEYNKDNIDKKICRIIQMRKNVILYNDVCINANYHYIKQNYKNINIDQIPMLIIEGNAYKDLVEVELSRKEGIVSEQIANKIVQVIYEREIIKICKYLKENKVEEKNKLEIINNLKIQFSNLIWLPDILISKQEITIATRDRIEFLLQEGFKTVITIQGYGNSNIINYDEKSVYRINNQFVDKVIIADLIEKEAVDVIAISNDLLIEYIIYSNNGRKGFRIGTLKYILMKLGYDCHDCKKPVDFWNYVKNNSHDLIQKILYDNTLGYMCYLDNTYRDKKILSKERVSQTIIYSKPLNSSNVNLSDELFGKILEDKLKESND